MLYGTSVHPYSSHSDKPRSVVGSPIEDEYSEEYVGKSTLVLANIRKVARFFFWSNAFCPLKAESHSLIIEICHLL